MTSKHEHTQAQRAAMAKALRAAKAYLWDGREEPREASPPAICHSLYAALAARECSLHGVDLACLEIRRRLGDHAYVTGWLQARGLIDARSPMPLRTRILVQEYRHRWVDALVEEFS